MQRKKEGIWIQGLFWSGIVSGTCLGICLREWITEQISVYQSLISLQVSQTAFLNHTYLSHLLKIRMTEVIVLFGMVYAGWYLKLLFFLGFGIGFWIGTILTGLTFLYGIKGIVLMTAGLFPHFLIYGFAVLLLYEFSYKKRLFTSVEQIKIAVQILGVFAAGILCEWGIQPFLLKLSIYI